MTIQEWWTRTATYLRSANRSLDFIGPGVNYHRRIGLRCARAPE